MNNSTVVFAWGICLMFLGMVLYFFAFHPSGVEGPDGQILHEPGDILKWLRYEFQIGAGMTPTWESDATTDTVLTASTGSTDTSGGSPSPTITPV